MDLEVVGGIVPALSALNRSGRELEVLDRQGTPFPRIGPRGAEGNAAATAFYRPAAHGLQPSRSRQLFLGISGLEARAAAARRHHRRH